MAKLRKARPSTGSTQSTVIDRAPSSSSSSSSPHRRRISSITPPPIALRTAARKSSASVVAPALDATGEFTGPGTGEIRSSSSAYSSESISRSPRSIPFPPSSPSHSRNASSSTVPPSFTPASPSHSLRSIHPFPTEIGTSPLPSSSPSSGSSSSALAQLRHRLDSDQHAREFITLQDKEHSGRNKLKKKHRPLPRDNRDDDDEEEEEEEEETGQPRLNAESVDSTSALTQEEVVEETIVMQVVEESEEVVPPDQVPQGDEDEEEEEIPSTEPNTSLPSSSRPEAEEDTTPRGEGGSILFAPARLGWRVATGTISFGIDTSKSVARRVPIVGRFVPADPTAFVKEQKEEEEEDDKSPSNLRPPLESFSRSSSSSSSLDSFAPSTASALRRVQSRSSSPSSVSDARPTIHETTKPSKKSHLIDEKDNEHGIVYKAAELSLGLGIASVLVTGALGQMAWRRVVGGSQPKESK